ncbi:MAG: LysE/ArgO family amino acid transporter [Rhizobiaceae bacterium]
MIGAAAAGFALGASLIIAIGAQNAFILRMGLLRQHVFIVCLACASTDAILIVLGVAGAGIFVEQFPGLLNAVKIAGALYLLGYAILSARRAFSPHTLRPDESAPMSLNAALAQCMAFTLLNPHVYLDTVMLIGAYSAGYEGAQRLLFTAGAVTASFIWFFGLGYGARLLTGLFARPMSWRILDGAIALVMTVLALALLQA